MKIIQGVLEKDNIVITPFKEELDVEEEISEE